MSSPLEGTQADRLAAAALACPAVARLSAGRVGEVATYLPGRRVPGVRVGDGRVAVHVVGRYGPACAQIADQVRRAVRAVAGDLPVDVVIDDLELPDPLSPPTSQPRTRT